MFNFISVILNWFKPENNKIKNEYYNTEELGDTFIQSEMFDDLFN